MPSLAEGPLQGVKRSLLSGDVRAKEWGDTILLVSVQSSHGRDRRANSEDINSQECVRALLISILQSLDIESIPSMFSAS